MAYGVWRVGWWCQLFEGSRKVSRKVSLVLISCRVSLKICVLVTVMVMVVYARTPRQATRQGVGEAMRLLTTTWIPNSQPRGNSNKTLQDPCLAYVLSPHHRHRLHRIYFVLSRVQGAWLHGGLGVRVTLELEGHATVYVYVYGGILVVSNQETKAAASCRVASIGLGLALT